MYYFFQKQQYMHEHQRVAMLKLGDTELIRKEKLTDVTVNIHILLGSQTCLFRKSKLLNYDNGYNT